MTAARLARVTGGAALFVALDWSGRWVSTAASLPVPGSILGMLALVVLVRTRVLRDALVSDAAGLLVRHLPLLYVPAGVALLVHARAVGRDTVAIVAAGSVSLVLTLLTIGAVASRLERDAA